MSIWQEFLYAALQSEFGIAISVGDPTRAKQALYRAQRLDASLAGLSIRTSPKNPQGELWIVKNA